MISWHHLFVLTFVLGRGESASPYHTWPLPDPHKILPQNIIGVKLQVFIVQGWVSSECGGCLVYARAPSQAIGVAKHFLLYLWELTDRKSLCWSSSSSNAEFALPGGWKSSVCQDPTVPSGAWYVTYFRVQNERSISSWRENESEGEKPMPYAIYNVTASACVLSDIPSLLEDKMAPFCGPKNGEMVKLLSEIW